MILYTDNKPTDAYKLGVRRQKETLISDYAKFHNTFIGYNFLCRNTNTVLRKSQVYHKNPSDALLMERSLMIPSQYILVEYKPLVSTRKKSA